VLGLTVYKIFMPVRAKQQIVQALWKHAFPASGLYSQAVREGTERSGAHDVEHEGTIRIGNSSMTDKPVVPNLANELAKERNREAAERTLMAWIRTALSLIGFGFGIGKLDAYLQWAGLHTRHDPAHTSLIFATSFIAVGILGLLAAVVQHVRILKRLSHPDFAYNAMRPIAMTVAALLILIGVFGLFAILW
jgi:putative membrane protein